MRASGLVELIKRHAPPVLEAVERALPQEAALTLRTNAHLAIEAVCERIEQLEERPLLLRQHLQEVAVKAAGKLTEFLQPKDPEK